MLTLRTHIGLTQAGLGERLRVSRRAVVEWEAGSSYPKVDSLKGFIALCVQHQAFPMGREEEEIRAVWKAARQRRRETFGKRMGGGRPPSVRGLGESPRPSLNLGSPPAEARNKWISEKSL
jgi:DNA-binding XRE family transcriptional regulator